MDSGNREIYRELTEKARRKMAEIPVPDDDKALEIIEEIVFESDENLEIDRIAEAVDYIFSRLRSRTGPLMNLIKDEEINEIMVNGPSNVYVERNGVIEKSNTVFESERELEDVIRKIAADVHREINEMNPVLDARLSDGSRVNAVYRNVAINGPVLTIRKFSKKRIRTGKLIEKGTLTEECALYMKKLVRAGYNIFVSGGTSSGKTTMLNALSDFIPEDERLIVIEDSAELQIDCVPNIVRMETRNANAAGKGDVSMGMLIKTSLRQRPDRIIIGEVRGSEVADMLQALNTGHSGMSTGHGNSVRGMLRRMEAMYLMDGKRVPVEAIRAQIGEAVEIVVHMQRTGKGERKIVEVAELTGYENGEYVINPLFITDFSGGGELEKTGNNLVNDLKLKML